MSFRLCHIQQVFSIQEIADTLISRLDRDKIFPPFYYNQPIDFIVPTQQGHIVKSNCFFFCCKNVKEEANRFGNGNMRIILKASGILWRNATNGEKEIYEDLYNEAKNLCIQMNSNAPAQQPANPAIVVAQTQMQAPVPLYEMVSNMYNTGFAFNTMESIEFPTILDEVNGPSTQF
ncbi:hypothetical protein RclHR1_09190005 [Rhizophagus clarus]|uniref:HMG box domain-containing protein n=1 Tax=Rhizophagus clarus TaxID=94130 RepID=A0A2Z6SQ33_9GLOM|nr:hypothetical protein RclHR1_09190005 [Rhizophagus clarus]GES78678.1 hypothetical protein GLOIN_2v1767631 [Rhizophagus clarus]